MANNRRGKHNPSTHSNSYNHDMETKFDENTMISSQLNELKSELKQLGGLKDLHKNLNVLKINFLAYSKRSPLSKAIWITSKKKINRDLEEKNAKLDSQLNELQQYGRRQNLEIHGIPMPDNETNTDVEEKVLRVLKKLSQLLPKILLMLYTDSEEYLKLIKT